MSSDMPDYSKWVTPHVLEVCPLPKVKLRSKAIGDKALDEALCVMAFNENVLGPSPKAMKAMGAALDKCYCYPDDSYSPLKKALAKKHNIPEEMIHVTNGGSEFLYLVGRIFLEEGDETIIAKPTFMLYPDIALQTKAVTVEVPGDNHEHDLLRMAEAITDKTKVIWISNPSNPSGTYNNAEEVDKFVKLVDDRCLIVFDEAYGDFVDSNDFPQTINYLLEGRKVCIMHTFSKNYGLAGLRVGYGIADPGLLDYLPAVRIRFTVSITAQEAALAALEDKEYIERSKRFVRDAREYYYQELDRLGLKYVPTQTNFILFDTGKDSRAVSDALKRKGFLIRPGWIFGLDNHIRVTFGDRDTNERFIKAFEEVLDELG
jgi:histidinol-phosphate aminotransferase